MCETFIKIDSLWNTLKFEDKPILRTGQKSRATTFSVLMLC